PRPPSLVLSPYTTLFRSPRLLALDLAGAQADVVTFDAGLAQGDAPALEQAIALYRGPLLAEWTEEWAFQERQAREQAYLTALKTDRKSTRLNSSHGSISY